MKKQKPVLFVDFDDTLCHDKFWRSLEPEQIKKVQEYVFSSDNTLVRDWMNGIYTSEDINKKVAMMLGVKFDSLWKVFVSDCQNMFVDKNILESLNKLRGKHMVVLMTDNMDCFDRFTVPSLQLDKYFDKIINSHTEKVSKNDKEGRLFKEVVARTGAELDRSLLADNSKKTCAIFEKLGGRSLFVTKEKPLAYWLDLLISNINP